MSKSHLGPRPVAAPAPEPDRHAALVEALASGKLRLYQLPEELPAEEAAEVRRRALEALSGSSLAHVGHYSLDARRAAGRHCENFIGVAQVPMGVAGPLTVHGQEVDGDVYVPLATTEGALVASINRGATAIRQAGGAQVFVEDVGMTRAPVFETTGLAQTQEFLAWIVAHEDDIRRLAEGTSRYLRLLDIRPFAFGTTVFLRFRLSSGDAMGMNMATIACDRVVSDYLVPRTGVRCVALSGNYCVDKKPAAINFQEGRGKRIHAEVVLSAEVLRRCLKTDARALVEVQYRKNLLGSIAAGAQGFNAHMANVVASFFLATGQDVAHVVGGSMGITSLELREPDSVYASIFLPDLPLGAIGGGTSLATQREALGLLGVVPDPARPGAAATRLAEILGAAVLAGELSLMAAFTSRDLARAHERLSRGKGEGEPGSGGDEAAAAAAEAPARPSRRPGTPAVVSAPGKVILMGEHAVVYGRPALVAALDLRLTARVSPLPGAGPCRLELRDLGVVEEAPWEEILAYGERARAAWREYERRPGPEAFARLRGEDPAHVVKVALAEAGAGLAAPPPRFALVVDSQLPVGAGFGSSAATAVATIQALLAFAGEPAEAQEVARLALEAERRQHGLPSGVDGAAVLAGGLVWARRVAARVEMETLGASSALLGRFRLFNTGSPAEPTGAVVAAVAARSEADPLRLHDLFDRLERAAWGLRQELARPQESPSRVIGLLRQAHACLCALGVVPEPAQALVAQVEARGGAAKISGAGALTGAAAGLLLVYHPSPEEVERWDFLAGLPRFAARLGAPGAHEEGAG